MLLSFILSVLVQQAVTFVYELFDFFLFVDVIINVLPDFISSGDVACWGPD